MSVQAGSSNIKWNYFDDDKGKKLYFLCLSACYVLRIIWMLQVLPGYVGTAESSYRISSLIYVSYNNCVCNCGKKMTAVPMVFPK